jgi:hypothetical protein
VTDRGIPRNDCSIGPQGARRVGHRARFACLLARLRVCPVVADLAHGVGAGQAEFVRPGFEEQPPFVGVVTDAACPVSASTMAVMAWLRVSTRPGSHVTAQPFPAGRVLCGVVLLVIASSVILMFTGAPSSPPSPAFAAWGLHPIGAGVVEPGVEVKLRLLDALDWQRAPRERVVLVWRGRAKGSCV